MKNRNLSIELATKVYIVLANECGARDRFETIEKGPYAGSTHNFDRAEFVHEFTKDDPTREWRFSGKLGFGGKFWHANDRFYVSCYAEDETPAIREMIENANNELAILYKEYQEEKRQSC